jgi:hypothetical protein
MNKSGNVVADIVFWSFAVGGILVLTRPGSQGPGFVKNLMSGYTGIVQGSTGQTVTG